MERRAKPAIIRPAICLITYHSSLITFPGGVAERLNAPVLKTGRPKGLVSSNLTPSATRKNGANLPDEIANCGLHLPKIRTQFDRPARFAPVLKAKRQYRSQSEALDNLTPSALSIAYSDHLAFALRGRNAS